MALNSEAATDHGASAAPRRSAARLAAVQALFQMEFSGVGTNAVIDEFNAHRIGVDADGFTLHDADSAFFDAIVKGVVDGQATIDRYISSRLAKGWRLERIDATARAILRAGVYELSQRPDVPYRVVIDEYVSIAAAFFEDGDELSFINGILDAAAAASRTDEIKKQRNSE
ncbi:MAG: transcription antitermination factor NusB [Pseudomonadota bacterium]